MTHSTFSDVNLNLLIMIRTFRKVSWKIERRNNDKAKLTDFVGFERRLIVQLDKSYETARIFFFSFF